MKKTITIAALFISTISFCVGQDGSSLDTRDQFHIGAKVGVNLANVYDTKGEDFKADSKTGLAFGAYLSIPIGTYLGVQPEVLYSRKGFKGKGKILGTNYDLKRTTSYLDIPLFLALKPSEFITVLAGPQFSYLLSKKDVLSSGSATTAQEKEFKNENIRKNTLGVSLGIDININHFVIGARANWDLQTNNGDGTSTTPRYKNQWLQATVGFRF